MREGAESGEFLTYSQLDVSNMRQLFQLFVLVRVRRLKKNILFLYDVV